MTIRAILSDERIHAPAVEVLAGRMTVQQADATYAGESGECPDCREWLQQLDPMGGGSLLKALHTVDKAVYYRKGAYATADDGSTLIRRVMCFCHARGYRKAIGGASPCSGGDDIHSAVVGAIADYYRRDLGDEYQVVVEPRLQLQLDRRVYSPDVSIRHTPTDSAHICIEFQRSGEKHNHFTVRHTTRAQEWAEVIWFFDKRIYSGPECRKTRNWLYERQQLFFCCWIDPDSGRLQVEEGTPAEEQQAQGRKNRKLERCSEASLINALEDATDPNGGTLVHVQEAPRLLLPDSVDFAQQMRQVQLSMRDEYQRIVAQQQADAEAERRRQAWYKLDFIRRHVAILGERAQTPATEQWSTEDLLAEYARLKALEPEANKAHRAKLEREEQEREELKRKQEERRRLARPLIEQITRLRDVLLGHGIREFSQATLNSSLEFLQQEIDRLNRRLEEERERQRLEAEERQRLEKERQAAAERQRLAEERRKQEQKEIERRCRWRSAIRAAEVWGLEVPEPLQDEHLEDLEQQIQVQMDAALKAIGLSSARGVDPEELKARYMAKQQALEVSQALAESPIEAVSALADIQQERGYNPRWIIGVLFDSSRGASLDAWIEVSMLLGYSTEWAGRQWLDWVRVHNKLAALTPTERMQAAFMGVVLPDIAA